MKLNDRDVSLVLSPDGREVMQLSAINLPEDSALWVRVQEADDIGLWIRAPREDGDHLLLVRWEYVLSIDFPAGGAWRNVGLNQ